MNYMIDPLLELKAYREVLERAKENILPATVAGPSDSQKAHICYALCRHSERKGIFVTYNEMQARRMYEDFSYFYGERVLFFPSKEIMLHDVEAKSYDSVFNRIKVIDRIVMGDYDFVVTSAEAILQKLVSPSEYRKNVINIKSGDEVNVEEIYATLTTMGYERVSTVEGKGQYAVRGGIIDIFSINMENAVRIELFGDEIDSIRSFDIISQRSVDSMDSVRIIPSREVIYDEKTKQSVIDALRKDLKEIADNTKLDKEFVQNLKSNINNDIERLRSDHYFPGIDRYIPYIINTPSNFIEYCLGDNPIIFSDEMHRIEDRAENMELELEESCKTMLEKGRILNGSFHIYFKFNEIEKYFNKSPTIFLSTMPSEPDIMQRATYNIVSKSLTSYQGKTDLLAEELKYWREKQYRIVVLAGLRARGQRLAEEITSKGVSAVYIEDLNSELQRGLAVVTRGSLHRGFEYPEIGLTIVGDKEIYGQTKKAGKRGKKTAGERIKSFTDVNPGDFVVHQAHGIGQYIGIQQLAVDGVKKDYFKIKFQDDGFLYIPTNQMDLIQKYIGSEGKAPKLSKLGGSDWQKAKAKVKESLRELAEELVKLYARRKMQEGYAFHEDTTWQKEFEESFPYEETEDQLRCIEEVKRDMEASRPMDRLLCGDVGYGKTEVAIRAIFKAVMDGKQVAYLCPTTILAQQHYNNFKERMADYPVTVEVMSRFKTPSEQRQIVRDLKVGNVDVLVGTHRLIQKDVKFKDIGLLIVDEEQRFGVTHKEKLKELKTNIDCLTLTATPIPRTLHMSLVGIRDISVLEDPPEERYPVQTYVMEYNEDVLKDAILRELTRKGQVFYLYNKVRTIQIKAAEIQALVPEARVEVAHGQMSEKELEHIMERFMNKEYDVLVCTTIIESGLDLPNVNTIIVEDADRMGLAQLYQIRGRVGRSNRLAYAYITYKRDKLLSEVAEKRLQAIKEFTEFGSGFKIAMRDLEIRGAGNLLGPEQHGHMESVGYDMYCKLLDEAVRELTGEAKPIKEADIQIDINISAYIDSAYINNESSKIEMYKRIAAITGTEDVIDVQDELTDRYGDIPSETQSLIQIALIKAMAAQCGFASIQEKGDNIVLQYYPGKAVDFRMLGTLTDKYKRNILFTANNSPYITYKAGNVTKKQLLENIKLLLQDILSFNSGKE